MLSETKSRLSEVKTGFAGKTLSTLFIFIFLLTTTQAQDIVETLSGSTASQAISFKNSSGTTLFKVRGDGNVGIGTTAPDAMLQIGSTSAPASLRFDGSSGNAEDNESSIIEFYTQDASGDGPQVAAKISKLTANADGSGGKLAFFTAPGDASSEGQVPTQRMIIDEDGNVGIGTTSPIEKLTVAGRVESTTGGFKFPDGTVQSSASYTDDRDWWISGNDIYSAVSGNVGIGTTNPSAKLDVVGITELNGNVDINSDLDVDNGTLHVDGTNNRVGIGTISPGEKFTVAGTVESTTGGFKFPDGTVQSSASGKHYIGESYGGGIVFWVDATGQHGLIAATSDQNGGNTIRWFAGTNTYTMARGDGIGAGEMNTAIIIANQGFGNGSTYAARVSADLVITSGGVDYGDWYLPSKGELNLMFQQKTTIGSFSSGYYWSSTEFSNNPQNAWMQYFFDGGQNYTAKFNLFYMRAVRAF